MKAFADCRCIAVVVAATVFLPGCESADPLRERDFPKITARLRLEDATGASTRVFDLGEPITMVLTIRNGTNENQCWHFPSSCQHQFIVYGARGQEVCNRPRACLWIPTGFCLQPGQSKTFTSTWNQKDNDGRPVGRGSYEAEGCLLTRRLDAPSDSRQFKIQ
jgi:hypothetical protein